MVSAKIVKAFDAPHHCPRSRAEQNGVDRREQKDQAGRGRPRLGAAPVEDPGGVRQSDHNRRDTGKDDRAPFPPPPAAPRRIANAAVANGIGFHEAIQWIHSA